MEQNLKKSLKIGLIFFVIGLLIGSLIVYAATPSSTFYISSGVYPGAPGFTVWKEGANYFAKDANGQIQFSGTNASQVINNAASNIGYDGSEYIATFDDCDSIYLTGGEYELSGSIRLHGYTKLFGAGMFKTVLRPTATFAGNIIENYNQIEGDWLGAIEDLAIYGRKATQPSGHGIELINCKDWTIREVRIFETKQDGIHIEGGFQFYISHCLISACDGYACYAGNIENGLRAYNSVFETSGGAYNLYVSVGSANEIIGNHFEDGQGTIYMGGYYSKIIGNYIKAGTSYAIYVTSSDNVIQGNNIWGCDATAIILEDAQRSTVVGNTIYNINGNGINVQGHSYAVAVGSNTIENVTDNGISLYGTSNNCTVTGNIITQCSYGIVLSDVNNIVVTANTIRTATNWGIYESGSADYNIITSCNARTGTNGILKLGTNTYVNLCWNNTVWIG